MSSVEIRPVRCGCGCYQLSPVLRLPDGQQQIYCLSCGWTTYRADDRMLRNPATNRRLTRFTRRAA